MFKKLSTETLFVVIICSSFLIGWFCTFGIQAFFNPQNIMLQPQVVPSLPTIGYDLSETLKSSKELLAGRTPYVLKIYSYSPFASVLFVPLTLVSFKIAYLIVFLATLILFVISVLATHKLFVKQKESLVLLLFLLLTGVISYGMSFELERGQFNMLAFACALLGLYFFANTKKVIGLIFLTLGMQLKIYPAIFIVQFFIHSFKVKRDWLLAGGVVSINFLLLFVGGIAVFKDFIKALLYQMGNAYYWIGNHSVASYCDIANAASSFCTPKSYSLLLGGFFLLFGITTFLVWKYSKVKANPYLFTLSGLGMLIIPSASHDYTLAVLPVVLYPLLKEFYDKLEANRNVYGLFMAISLTVYTTILFNTYHAAPINFLTDSKTPALITLILITFIATLLWSLGERVNNKGVAKRG